MTKKLPARPISPLYARYLTSDEKRALRVVVVNDPTSEINLLRVLLAHFMQFQLSAPKEMDSRAQTLRTCLVLSEQIAKLVRAYNAEHDLLVELQDLIEQALEEIRKEWGIE